MLDRCGKHFGSILNFLRDGNIALPETRRELLELQVSIFKRVFESLVY